MGEKRSAYRILMGKPERKRPLGKTRRKWDHNINKKFWEELIAYFLSYDTGHIENDGSSNSSIVACVFVTAVTFLPSRCIAAIGGIHIHTAT
jgi:hypothetical protein